MCKFIAIGLLVLLVALMVGAALVVQEYGWQGFLVLLAVLLVLGYAIKKLAPRLFVYMLTRPFRQMGAALRGARLVVHSVIPCEPPPPEEYGEDPDNDSESIEDGSDEDDEESGDDEEPEEEEEPVGPLDWYEIEFTVIPPDGGSSEGRIVTRQGWNPPLIGAVDPRAPLEQMNPFRGWPPPDQVTSDVHNTPAEVWTGYEYEQPEEALFGEHRLRMRVGVAGRIHAVTITYAHFTNLGEVPLPRIDVRPGDGG
jgi:hypothetical protein